LPNTSEKSFPFTRRTPDRAGPTGQTPYQILVLTEGGQAFAPADGQLDGDRMAVGAQTEIELAAEVSMSWPGRPAPVQAEAVRDGASSAMATSCSTSPRRCVLLHLTQTSPRCAVLHLASSCSTSRA
jgi:hypothetical protein